MASTSAKFLNLLAATLAVAASLSSACKAPTIKAPARAFIAEEETEKLYASDKAKLDDVREFYYKLFGQDQYSNDWTELEKYRSGSGIAARMPYLDSWYPQSRGGTDVNGALKRYDKAFYNNQAKASAWEAQNHNGTESWFGHCDGTSVSSIRFLNPIKSVMRPAGCNPSSATCTEFTPQDIRALLSEINVSALWKSLAGARCDMTKDQLIQRPRSRPLEMDICDDVNPASFHVSMLNFLGRMKQPLIFDFNFDNQIWNYPVYRYEYIASAPLSEAQAIAATGQSLDSWIYNPQAVSWYRITMTVFYRKWSDDLTGAGTVPATLNTKTYTYILELNKAKQVIGGEWIGASLTDHPDFIWMPFEPILPSGKKEGGNPLVRNSDVIKLWTESVGLDPLAPFQDKPDNPYDVRNYPKDPDLENWGRVLGYYQVMLDGRTNGATFLGKRIHMRVDVIEVLKTSTSVEALVNGIKATSGNIRDGKVELQFDAKPGINILSLRWTSAQVDSRELDREFRFYAM